MSLHLSARFPAVALIVAALGLLLLFIAFKKDPWRELGKAMLWGGIFSALFFSAGSC